MLASDTFHGAYTYLTDAPALDMTITQRITTKLKAVCTPRAEVARGRAIALGAVSQAVPRDVTGNAESPLDALVEAWINRSHLEHGNVVLAVAAVHQALQLAEPERIRRPFIDSTHSFGGCCASIAR